MEEAGGSNPPEPIPLSVFYREYNKSPSVAAASGGWSLYLKPSHVLVLTRLTPHSASSVATAFGVREAKVGHMKDAREEVGYTGTGFVLGVGIGTLLRAANGGSVDVANVVDVVGRFAGSILV